MSRSSAIALTRQQRWWIWLCVAAVMGFQALGLVHTARIAHFLRHPRFPVDIRHNAKIGREQLARWATDVLRRKQ